MIGDKIRKAREEKRYSQDYLAAQLGLNQSTYCRIETGKIIPSIKQLHQIAVILGTDFMNLTDEQDGKNSDS
jgi:transcriptional regulator with XRE-family HTH domain